MIVQIPAAVQPFLLAGTPLVALGLVAYSLWREYRVGDTTRG